MRSETQKPASYQPVDVERVMQAAGSLFATFGYEGVGTREIARSSGCHVPSIYYHFSSKENLYREVFDERWGELLDSVQQALNIAEAPQARLQAFIATFYEYFAQDRELLVLLMRDVINASVAPPRYQSGSGHARLLAMTVQLLSELRGREVDTHLAFTVMSLIFGYGCGLQLTGGETIDAATRKQHLFEMVLRMIGVDAA